MLLMLQVGAPAEEDLINWGHHPDVSTVPDQVMHKAAENDVTFVFSCQVDPLCSLAMLLACHSQFH